MLYQHVGDYFTSSGMWWATTALLQSVVVFLLAVNVFGDGILSSDGRGDGLLVLGTILSGCNLLAVTIRVGFLTSIWSNTQRVALVGSVVVWMVFVSLYSLFDVAFYYAGIRMLSS